MSERPDAADLGEDSEIQEPIEDQEDGREPEGEGDEDESPRPKPVDWEKKAHSHAGQAARERSKRQAAERRNVELEQRLERLEKVAGAGGDELLDLIGLLPDEDTDPVGDIAALKRALKLYRAREMGSADDQRAQQRVHRQIETIRETMADAEADFATDHPDYHEAAKFYREARAEELSDLGYAGNELMAKLANELFGLVQTSFNAGLDPAERVYKLAAKRGFKANGKAVNAKLDALQRASESGVRPQSRPAAGVLSWGDVAKLDGAARDKAWAALRKREMGRK
jgi:hypothetical protein